MTKRQPGSLQKAIQHNRRKTGILLSIGGVLLNLLLFAVKLCGGRLSGSAAITADGFNNLADTFSCILSLSGFILGAKKPGARYPMGYGRFEYLSGLLISAAILFIGCRAFCSSVMKIRRPEPIDSSLTVILILIISVLIKGTMYLCYNRIGVRISSSGMRAAALDSLSDCCATAAILIAVGIEKLSGICCDGWTGAAVALCILYAGICSLKESVGPLTGKAPDQKLLRELEDIFISYAADNLVRDIRVHDYGPERKIVTFYIETGHDDKLIPDLRNEIQNKTGIEAVICPLSQKES